MDLLGHLFSPTIPEDEGPDAQHHEPICPSFSDSSYSSLQLPALSLPSNQVFSTAGPNFNVASLAPFYTPTNYTPFNVAPDSIDAFSLISQQSAVATLPPTPAHHLLDDNRTTVSVTAMDQYAPYATQQYWSFPFAKENTGGSYLSNSYSQMITPFTYHLPGLNTSTDMISQNLNCDLGEQASIKTEPLPDDSIACYRVQEVEDGTKAGVGVHRRNPNQQHRKQPYEVPHDRKLEGGSSNSKPNVTHRAEYSIAWSYLPPSDSLVVHTKRDDSPKGKSTCSGCSVYRTYISDALKCWAELTRWSSETLEDAKRVWEDLVNILKVESMGEEKTLRENQDAFKGTLSNPGQFSDFVNLVLSTRRNLSCEKVSISRSTANKHVKRLGVVSKNVYATDDFRLAIRQLILKSLCSFSPVPSRVIENLNNDLYNRRVSGGKTEIIASHDVEKYFAALFHDVMGHAGFLIQQLRLGNSDEEQTLEVSENDSNEKVYVTCRSKMDFLVVALNRTKKIRTGEGKPEKTVTNTIPPEVLNKGFNSKGLLEDFHLWSRPYSDVKAHMTKNLSRVPKHLGIGYQTTIVEVKQAKQPFTLMEDRKGKVSGKSYLDSSSTINQVLSTCRVLSADWSEDERVMTFMSTDARYWRFGIMNNDTGEAHYTELFDNSNLDITEEILHYISALNTLAPRLINDEIFARCTPKEIILS